MNISPHGSTILPCGHASPPHSLPRLILYVLRSFEGRWKLSQAQHAVGEPLKNCCCHMEPVFGMNGHTCPFANTIRAAYLKWLLIRRKRNEVLPAPVGIFSCHTGIISSFLKPFQDWIQVDSCLLPRKISCIPQCWQLSWFYLESLTSWCFLKAPALGNQWLCENLSFCFKIKWVSSPPGGRESFAYVTWVYPKGSETQKSK